MIVVGSVRSSGATTLALALAGSLEGAVLVEADPDGGVLALRYGLGREPGLLTLAASRQVTGDTILDHAQRLPGGLPVVVAPESPDRATHLLRTAGQRLAGLLARTNGLDVVVDAGRLGPSSPAQCLVETASVTVIVSRPRVEELVGAAERVAAMGPTAGLVLAGSGSYTARDVEAQLRCPVLGTIADDPRSARALAEGGSAEALTRSALLRCVRTLATALANAPGASTAPHRRSRQRLEVGT